MRLPVSLPSVCLLAVAGLILLSVPQLNAQDVGCGNGGNGYSTNTFVSRLADAYHADWHGIESSGPPPARRGWPAPVSSPPFPFADWPYGGSPVTYGYDPVMFYADLYFPKVAQGMNLRIGRYISLPDIEAQLAPNNYTYSHSLLYTVDCYTQTGANATVKLNNAWLVQAGISGGCEAAPWISDAKLTGNACMARYWNMGGDDVYLCANAINDGKYAYNNVNAYYVTWYHKINSSWHSSTEGWYQYERDVPNIAGNVANPITPETGANGAFCAAGQLRCYAPDWAIVNYIEKDFNHHHDSLNIRNEYLDDIRGQRTGYKTGYSEHLVGIDHWIGSTVTFRPELRLEHSYNTAAYDLGHKSTQFTIAGDVIYHF